MHLRSIKIDRASFPTTDIYPFCLKSLQQTTGLTFDSTVTFFVGENGTGKSTLLEAICHSCGIHIWRMPVLRTVAKNPFTNELHRSVKPSWTDNPVPGSFFASEIFKDFARLLEEWAIDDPGMLKYFGGNSLLTMSHGQALMTYFQNRYRLRGLYLLDEPETALSPATQLKLLELLSGSEKSNQAQFIIATHSPILLSCPGAQIYDFDSCPIVPIDYEQTAHYRIYRDFFLNNR
jgi:predicted ATPase